MKSSFAYYLNVPKKNVKIFARKLFDVCHLKEDINTELEASKQMFLMRDLYIRSNNYMGCKKRRLVLIRGNIK